MFVLPGSFQTPSKLVCQQITGCGSFNISRTVKLGTSDSSFASKAVSGDDGSKAALEVSVLAARSSHAHLLPPPPRLSGTINPGPQLEETGCFLDLSGRISAFLCCLF